MLTALVSGFFTGAVYGLLAVGLVLVYKGARVFNFAQGEFGTLAAFTTWAMFNNLKLPYGVSVLIGLAAAVLAGLLMERLIVRPLLDAPRVTLLVATVGVALLIITVTLIVAEALPRVLSPAITGDPVVILNVATSRQQILVVVVLAALAGLLAIFFRTNTGLAILATSQDALATRIVGISVPGMSRFIWGFAALLGGIAGILQGALTIFFPGFMTINSLIPAFTGAVLGGMTSLPGAFLGGQLVGITQSLGNYVLGQKAGIPGASDLSVFVLLIAVLFVRPQGLFGKEA